MNRASTSPSTNPTAIARLGVSAARGRRRCAGRYTRPPTPPAAPAHPTASTTSRPPSGWAATAPVWRSRASYSSAATTRSANSARTPWRHPRTNGIAEPRAARQAAPLAGPSVQRPANRPMLWPLDAGFGSAAQQRVPARRPAHPTTSFPANRSLTRVKPSLTPMRRGQLPHRCCRHVRVDGLERLSGRNASPSGITPIEHLVAGPPHGRVVDQSKAGRPRAHRSRPTRPRTTCTDDSSRQ
jgi:hypothetical protein